MGSVRRGLKRFEFNLIHQIKSKRAKHMCGAPRFAKGCASRFSRNALALALTAVLPAPAWAEVCDKVRPDWDGAEVSLWSETVMLLGTPISLFLIISTAFAMRFRSSWGALVVFVGWSFAAATVTYWDPTGGLREAARQEGCIGSPALYVALVFAMCGAMLWYVNRVDKVEKAP